MSQHESPRPVTKSKPCQVCGADHKCSRKSDGLMMCGRMTGDVPGFFHIGPAKDSTWHLYRAEDDPELRKGVSPATRRRNRSGTDWEAEASQHAAKLTIAGRARLAAALGLPIAVLDLLPKLGVNKDDGGPHWTFPECDGRGRVVGINRRYVDGSKKVMPGGSRGLTIPAGWADRPGPVFVPEGASDTLALTAAGLAAVGRPSAKGGVEDLVLLLADVPADRRIIVLGENDQRPSKKTPDVIDWPGKEGVDTIAPKLAERLARSVHAFFPPDGAKDVRGWFKAKAGAA